jgi:hypothetical protein
MIQNKDVTIELNAKRIVALIAIIGITLFSAYTYIIALYAFDAPSQDLPLQVTNLEILENNVTQSSFSVGDTVTLNSTIEKALSYMYFPFSYDYFYFSGGTPFKLIVTIEDASHQPVFFFSLDGSIATGGILEYSVDYLIKAGSSTGVYTVNVLLWSDWLPDGDALSPEAEVGTFNVV